MDDSLVAAPLSAGGLPAEPEFRRWAETVLLLLRERQVTLDDAGLHAALHASEPLELAIRLVGEDESRALNHDYRGKDKPTNVLSFPAELPEMVLSELDERPLGDLVICAPVVAREADEQGKALAAHWAHMTVHGLLHLLGHDHVEAVDAAVMEPLEIAILARLGWDNPYDDEPGATMPDTDNERDATS
ncbi:MAG: rRNA maturation RNase YbeY [Perlucidibaca sp.]